MDSKYLLRYLCIEDGIIREVEWLVLCVGTDELRVIIGCVLTLVDLEEVVLSESLDET
jgi:hypothetical protein